MSRKYNLNLHQTLVTSVTPFALSLLALGIASPVIGQGVWADPDCGTEVSCGVEPACGVEPVCGVESSCGCESVCDCEPACGAEPACGCEASDPTCGIETVCECNAGPATECSCGAEPSCGLEPDCQCEPACGLEPACGAAPTCGCSTASNCGCDDGRERGLLARSFMPKSGPVFQLLDKVACGIEKLAMHDHASHRTPKNCSCSTCGNGTSQSGYQDGIELSPPSPHPHHHHSSPSKHSAPLPSPPLMDPIPSQTHAPKTTIRRTSPLPIPTPAPTRETSPSDRPGRTFDRLTNPFEDDSASRAAKREPSIRRTNYATSNETHTGTTTRTSRRAIRSASSQQDTDAADFSDYLRSE